MADIEEVTAEPTTPGMAVVGMIVDITPIEKADRLEAVRVECGPFGSWRAVVVKGAFELTDACIVFMPDAILPPAPCFAFMAKYHYRVRLQRLRGAPSEVLVLPVVDVADYAIDRADIRRADGRFQVDEIRFEINSDVTEMLGVTKHQKSMPAAMRGVAKGSLPSFIRKTDEVNFQRARHTLNALKLTRVYATVKCDGSSFTAFKNGELAGVCSRNLELKPEQGGAFWETARKYGLPENLPDGFALQAELVGPGIQGNPMGLPEVELRAFDLYDIKNGVYQGLDELSALCKQLAIPRPDVTMHNVFLSELLGPDVNDDSLLSFAAAVKYPNDRSAEGIVIRAMDPDLKDGYGDRLSLKVLNLSYKESE